MRLALQPVRVATGAEEDGLLVFEEDRLVAVLVQLSDEHGDLAGQWYYEHGFGPLDGVTHPVFPTLEAAQDWIDHRRHEAAPGRPPPQSRPAPPLIGEP